MNDVATSPLLTVQVLHAMTAFQDHLEEMLEPLGLSLAKLNVLNKLAQGPLTLSVLADRCSCVRSNITQLVDRLEADKLVVRSDDPKDRRSIRAELTAAGRARHDAGMDGLRQFDEQLLARLGPSQQALLPVLQAIAGEE